MAKEELRTELIVDAKGVKNGVDDGVEALEKMEKAFDGVGDEATKSGAEVDQSSSKMRDGLSKVGETLGTLKPAIQAAFVGAGVLALKTAEDFSSSQTKIQNSFGLTSAEAKKLNGTVEEVWKEGFGESVEEVSDALVKVKTNMQKIDGKELKFATKSALTLAKTFDADVNEVARAGGNIMESFGISSKEAFDLMAVGAQKGLNFSDEMFDNISEYAPLFKQAGFSADEMFNVLIAGTKDGAYNLDYVNDLIKEFGIRLQDGSKSTSEAMGSMSKDTQKMFKEYQKGKVTAATMFKTITKELEGMDDQQKATQLGTALMGTKFEDMGNTTVYAMGNAKNAIGDVSGAMDKMNKNDANDTFTRMKKILRETGAALLPVANIFLDLADEVLPYVSNGIKTASDLFNSMNPGMQKTVGIVLSLVAAGSAGKLALGGLTSILGGLLNPLSMFKGGAKGASDALEETAGKTGVAGKGLAGLGAKIGIGASSFGVYGIAAAAAGVALIGLGIALNHYKEKADISRERTAKWGSDVGKYADDTLTKFENFSSKASTAMDNFSTNTVANAETVKTAMAGMSNNIDKTAKDAVSKAEKEYNKLPDAIKATLKPQLDAYKSGTETMTSEAKKGSDLVSEIYTNAAKENRSITEQEKVTVNAIQKSMYEDQVNLLGLSSKEKKAVMAALNNDLSGMNAEQLQQRQDDLAIALSKENKEYEKNIGVLKQLYKAGVIDESSFISQTESLTNAHTQMTDTIGDNWMTAMRTAGDSEQTIKRVMANWGMEYKTADQITQQSSQNIVDNLGLVSMKALDAGGKWEGLDFKTKSAIINSNSPQEIQKILEGKGIWDDLTYQQKQAILKGNTKNVVKDALIDTETWNKLDFKTQTAVLASNSSDTLYEALSSNSTWNALPWDEKLASVTTNAGETGKKVLIENGKWSQMSWKERLAVVSSNSQEEINKVLRNHGTWTNTNFRKKDANIFTNSQATLGKVQGSNRVWNGTTFYAKDADVFTNAAQTQREVDNLKWSWNNWTPTGKSLGISVSSVGMNALNSVMQNANGSPNFGGGLTTLHERGDEIYDLPSGSRIIPHSLSESMMERAGRDYAKQNTNTSNTSTNTVELKIDKFYNNTPEDINSLSRRLGQQIERTKNPWRRQ
ncbi:hypothetical protein DUK53_15040 [Listeria sp. SHR_NRA_18]|uniref:phage tail tape measure protein n=1 Tax=Listeria sp. SHR_NRA_18 TaxID=2269046 RepID=UPI000F5E170B|nr:phage tail tape measure protein [Listeria sp. SHR_NRA_18]RQW65703.1 hypothetical protein DUK53_15040 [Listeria sp. SHR_NRA_18]